MGAAVAVEASDASFGEPVADLIARPAAFRATEVTPGEIPGLIDEIPLLAVLASRAAGETVFRDVGELRVKESDRLGLIADEHPRGRGKGEVQGDDLHVEGGAAAAAGQGAHRRRPSDRDGLRGARHAARAPGSRSTTWRCAAVSFPGFPETLRRVCGAEGAA